MRKRFHSIIYVPIKGAKGAKLPIILLQDGTRFYEALHWTVARYKASLSSTTLQKQNESLGRFIDLYYWLGGEQDGIGESPAAILLKFRDLRLSGFDDLGWMPISPRSVEREVEYISAFYDYCNDAFGYDPINVAQAIPVRSASFSQRLSYIRQEARKNSSLLGHLNRGSTGTLRARTLKQISKNPKDGNAHKTFPPEKVSELIESCNSIRDVLAFLLLFYGGLRSSELCHLFVQDICPSPDVITGQAIITVSHPVYGWVNYCRYSDGRHIENQQRQTYLKEEYGMTPRNLLPTSDPFHAGWKGMAYHDKGFRSPVIWCRPDIGILFYKLHVKYMRIRARIPVAHPYYFVNIDTARSRRSYGSPMKLKCLRDRFEDSCKRIGLTPGRDRGVNPHGARHFYGYFLANVLRLPKEIAQKFLRHVSQDSTEIYYNLSISIARDELLKGFAASRELEHQPLLKELDINVEGV